MSEFKLELPDTLTDLNPWDLHGAPPNPANGWFQHLRLTPGGGSRRWRSPPPPTVQWKPGDSLYMRECSGPGIVFGDNDFSNAHFAECDFSRTSWHSSKLGSATFTDCDLRGAIFSWADLAYARFLRCNLEDVNVHGARFFSTVLDDNWMRNFRSAHAPSMLLCNWCGWNFEEDLVRDLMHYDCANHPGGAAAFEEWVATGDCPFEPSTEFGTYWNRAALFTEEQESLAEALEDDPHFLRGPAPSALDLLQRLLRHTQRDSNFHPEREESSDG